MKTDVTRDYTEADLERFEELAGRRADFTLSHAWARAAETSGYGKAVRSMVLQGDRPIALAQGILRTRFGFRKLACGSNAGTGDTWLEPQESAANACLRDMIDRTRPSIFEAFTRGNHALVGVEWHPAYSFRIDLRKSLTEITSLMTKDARYAARRATRAGVVVVAYEDTAGIQRAYQLIAKTAEAKSFPLPPMEYNLALHREFGRTGDQAAIVATLRGEVVSAATLLGYGVMTTWWKGGSTPAGYRAGAGNLVQTHAVQWAKEQGFESYDLGGTHPSNPDYSGIHKFKKSLGGTLVETRMCRTTTAGSRLAMRLRRVRL